MAETVIDLRADLNCEGDDGLNWAELSDATEQGKVCPGAVLRAGIPGFWPWVRIVAVDDDGMVHFQQISGAEARQPLSATG